MRQTFSLVCDSELPVSNFCEMYRSSASFCAMMTCKDLSLLSKREILACVGVCVVGGGRLINAQTCYYDDYGVRIKETCNTMLQGCYLYQQLSIVYVYLKVSAVIGCSLTLSKALSKLQLQHTLHHIT